MSWAIKTFQAIGLVCLAGGITAAQAATARPGTVNYTEGGVTIDGQAVAAKSLGSTEVEPGQVLSTNQGKAEMLLTPGVFLRLGDHAAVKMVSPSLTDTRVELLQGEAMVEADQVLDGNHLVISEAGVDTQIQKNGLYRFTAAPGQLAVFDGKAQVFIDDRTVEVGKGKELNLTQAAALKPQSFDRHQDDNLYQWSSVRSQYVAQANQSSVQYIVAGDPWGWYGMGWYWNPWFGSWAFVPGYGYFGSPFGFGFYSPAYWRAYPPAHYFVRPGVAAVPAARGIAPGVRGGAPAIGMGGGIMHGGGFHGGIGGRR
jgi:hypothetical protein